MKILVTGAAGFIGAALTQRLLERGDEIIGIDNLNDYYDPQLKKDRLSLLKQHHNFDFRKLDISNRVDMSSLFEELKPQRVAHLAAQAGVRYSLKNPHAYIQANIDGFMNVLEACRHIDIEHLVFASSSSVYGANTVMPFSIHHNTDHPVSLYGATKKANEMMAHSYSHLYKIPVTGLRFFTVYGPWGRPDMSLFIFTRKILAGEPIDIFNNGRHARDFTYVDDIVTGVVKVIDTIPVGDPSWAGVDPASSPAPYRLYNIGNNRPVALLDFVALLEQTLGREASKNFLPMQPGDVPVTYADVEDLARDFGYSPDTSIETGMGRFVDWYKDYYNVG